MQTLSGPWDKIFACWRRIVLLFFLFDFYNNCNSSKLSAFLVPTTLFYSYAKQIYICGKYLLQFHFYKKEETNTRNKFSSDNISFLFHVIDPQSTKNLGRKIWSSFIVQNTSLNMAYSPTWLGHYSQHIWRLLVLWINSEIGLLLDGDLSSHIMLATAYLMKVYWIEPTGWIHTSISWKYCRTSHSDLLF